MYLYCTFSPSNIHYISYLRDIRVLYLTILVYDIVGNNNYNSPCNIDLTTCLYFIIVEV